MKLPRIYTDENGETHFDEIEWPLEVIDFVPPSPAGYSVTPAMGATDVRIMRTPAGYVDVFHVVPHRMLVLLLTGEFKLETSDGDFRIIKAGMQFLNDDTWRKRW